MTLDNVLALARKHLGSGTMESSARLCLADANEAKDRGDYCQSIDHAIRSLRYSVGVFHADYRRAARTEGALPHNCQRVDDHHKSMIRLPWDALPE